MEVEVTAEQIPRIALPHPEPIETEEVLFHVIETGDICLTGDQYDAMSRNISDILRWVREARWRLDWYHDDAEVLQVPSDIE